MNEKSKKNLSPFGLVLALLAFLMPAVALVGVPFMSPMGKAVEIEKPVASFPATRFEFERQSAYPGIEIGQMFTNVQLTDENGDGNLDILACDARRGRVVCLSQQPDKSWEEKILNPDQLLPAPARITPIDLDQDGDQDYLVASLGDIMPSNDLIGRVHWFENEGDGYKLHVILEDIRRTTDVQGGDFDGDGDIDLVVSVFGGLLQGQVLWLENDGQQNFTDYEVMTNSGSIHTPIADFDGDGDLDFAAVITQEEEEVYVFENKGKGYKDPGEFETHLAFSSWNFDLGGAGMVADDLDQDGDVDLLVALGDNLELINNFPQPWHGCLWLENKGNFEFESRRIGKVPGIYGVQPTDFDGDGDRDVVLVSMFNDWTQEDAASVVLLENDGKQNFTAQQVASDPIQLSSVACGDLDKDGKTDIVTGCFQFRSPLVRLGSVDIFFNKGGE